MTKLKSLLQLIDRNATVSIKYRWTSTQCDMEPGDCFTCEHFDFWSDEGCQQPEHLHDEIIKSESFNGRAEDVPFKLMETTVLAVDTYIQKVGKNGRKNGTSACIEILVKENDH